MAEAWSTLTHLEFSEKEIEARYNIPEISQWFIGHFPDFPLLPGIALLGLVQDVLQRVADHDKKRVTIEEFRRIRFKKIVRPDQDIEIYIKPVDSKETCLYRFNIKRGEIDISSGDIILRMESV